MDMEPIRFNTENINIIPKEVFKNLTSISTSIKEMSGLHIEPLPAMKLSFDLSKNFTNQHIVMSQQLTHVAKLLESYKTPLSTISAFQNLTKIHAPKLPSVKLNLEFLDSVASFLTKDLGTGFTLQQELYDIRTDEFDADSIAEIDQVIKRSGLDNDINEKALIDLLTSIPSVATTAAKRSAIWLFKLFAGKWILDKYEQIDFSTWPDQAKNVLEILLDVFKDS